MRWTSSAAKPASLSGTGAPASKLPTRETRRGLRDLYRVGWWSWGDQLQVLLSTSATRRLTQLRLRPARTYRPLDHVQPAALRVSLSRCVGVIGLLFMCKVNYISCADATTISRCLWKLPVNSQLQREKSFRARHLLPAQDAGNGGFVDAHALGNLGLLDALALHLRLDLSDFASDGHLRGLCRRSCVDAINS